MGRADKEREQTDSSMLLSQQWQHKSLGSAPSRQAAVQALGAVAAKGNEVAIAALVKAAGQDEDRDV
eukprot:6489787-Amphidinium_carterae.1